MFTFRMILSDGTPADPPTFLSSEPNWHAGEKVMVTPRLAYRIVEVRSAEGVSGEWIVEKV
jgi:hypothetical protein